MNKNFKNLKTLAVSAFDTNCARGLDVLRKKSD